MSLNGNKAFIAVIFQGIVNGVFNQRLQGKLGQISIQKLRRYVYLVLEGVLKPDSLNVHIVSYQFQFLRQGGVLVFPAESNPQQFASDSVIREMGSSFNSLPLQFMVCRVLYRK